MCTVLLRIDPAARWPVVLGAIRDEFVERPWDRPDRHWPEPWGHLVGGRDQRAGGTWLAVDPGGAVAALLNGGRREELPDGATRPTRGTLALRVLAPGAATEVPEGDELEAYDRFHLLRITAADQELWSWDGERMVHAPLAPGLHIVVNGGLDVDSDPLVPHFLPLLEGVGDADHLVDTVEGWGGWPALLTGDGLAGDDPRALLVEKLIEGHAYGSTSAALVALAPDGRVRYDFTATPADPRSWERVL